MSKGMTVSHIMIANIYRPPNSKPTFLAKLADFIPITRIEMGDYLVRCCDLNLPGANRISIYKDLKNLIDTRGLHQHVMEPTNQAISVGRENILDLIVARTCHR